MQLKKKVQTPIRKREWQKQKAKELIIPLLHRLTCSPELLMTIQGLNCRSQDLSTIVTVNVVPMIQVLWLEDDQMLLSLLLLTSYMWSRVITTITVRRCSVMAYTYTFSTKSWWKLFSHMLYRHYVYLIGINFLITYTFW